MEKLDQEQIGFIIKCICQWVRIREEEGHPPVREPIVNHSALLRRLLNGQKPLTKPPPKTFSHPNYELGEGKLVEIMTMIETNLPEIGDCIVIDHDACWMWYDKDKQILIYVPTQELYQLTIKDNKKYLQKIEQNNDN